MQTKYISTQHSQHSIKKPDNMENYGGIKKHNRETGIAGENLAASYLESRGYAILHRNFRCKSGEIDIIARKGQELCFIEVKTRCSTRFGSGAEAIDGKKISHIRNCADYYMKSVNWKGNAKICPIIISLNFIELDWVDTSGGGKR